MRALESTPVVAEVLSISAAGGDCTTIPGQEHDTSYAAGMQDKPRTCEKSFRFHQMKLWKKALRPAREQSPAINRYLVDVLKGTRPALGNREAKYLLGPTANRPLLFAYCRNGPKATDSLALRF
jgi:hypothetical protein